MSANPAVGSKAHIIPNNEMPSHAYLPAHLHPRADAGAPGDSALRRNEGLISDLTTVGDHHQIVQLGPRSDSSNPDRSAIHGGIRANFDVIPDFDGTDLPQVPDPASGKRDVPKAFTPDDRTGRQSDPIPNAYSFADHDVRVCREVIPDQHFFVDDHARMKFYIRADAYPWANVDPRRNLGSFPDLGTLRHVSARIHSRCQFGRAIEELECLREPKVGIRNTNDWAARPLDLWPQNHRGRRGFRQLTGVARIRKEREKPWSSLVERGQSFDFWIPRSFNLPAQPCRNFRELHGGSSTSASARSPSTPGDPAGNGRQRLVHVRGKPGRCVSRRASVRVSL